MTVISKVCHHCGATNLVATCRQDGRPFVLTTAHVAGRLRDFQDGSVAELPPGFDVPVCDFCFARATEQNPIRTTNAGLRQRTCPACHTEFLSEDLMRPS